MTTSSAVGDVDIFAIKRRALDEFGHVEGVTGFGIGDGTLRIYVQNQDAGDALPREYQGVPVEVVVTGDVMAYCGTTTSAWG
ncbi:MAG: hypothetical protein ACLQVD_21150 [Capsulimonadaceae bacterium]